MSRAKKNKGGWFKINVPMFYDHVIFAWGENGKCKIPDVEEEDFSDFSGITKQNVVWIEDVNYEPHIVHELIHLGHNLCRRYSIDDEEFYAYAVSYLFGVVKDRLKQRAK